MNILAIGDVVSTTGCDFLRKNLYFIIILQYHNTNYWYFHYLILLVFCIILRL
jgi:hypothetical protein